MIVVIHVLLLHVRSGSRISLRLLVISLSTFDDQRYLCSVHNQFFFMPIVEIVFPLYDNVQPISQSLFETKVLLVHTSVRHKHLKYLFCLFELRHDKTNKVSERPAKTQISLGFRPV